MKVAVIGAGVAGLGAIKTCLEEGLSPECFEIKDGLGGVWNYLPTPVDSLPSVIWSTVSNSCKTVYCYSDFPFPEDFPNFLHHTKVIEYLRMYAEKFDLERYIQYSTEVTEVEQTEDFESTGQWLVRVKDTVTGKRLSKVFDAVLVCNGHLATPLTCHLDGSAEFQGQQMHSHLYRTNSGFEGKRVLVVGFSNTAGDIAVELSHVCSQVYMSTRHRNWIFPRTMGDGMTLDYVFNRRFINALPSFLVNRFFAHRLNAIFDQSLYGVKPTHAPENQLPIMNDALHSLLASNRIIFKPNVQRLTKTGAVFEDGTREENIDAIVYATGYKIDMSFVKHPSYGVREDTLVDLFRFVFAPDVDPPTMAIIGCVQPSNSVLPITEMQCRWAVAVFKGEVSLPSEDAMKKEVLRRRQTLLKQYAGVPRYTTLVDWIEYMDEIAEELDCKPNWLQLLFTDPRLALHVLLGQCIPSQYRLRGRGAWPNARQTILTNWDRMTHPYRTHRDAAPIQRRHLDGRPRLPPPPSSMILLVFGLSVVVIAFVFYIF